MNHSPESVIIPYSHEGKVGYCYGNGRVLVEPKFTMGHRSSEGIAVAYDDAKRLVLISLDGSELVLEGLGYGGYGGGFQHGMLSVRLCTQDRYGYIDRYGDWAIPPAFGHCHNFDQYGATVKLPDESKLRRISRSGELLEGEFREICKFHNGGKFTGARLHYDPQFEVVNDQLVFKDYLDWCVIDSEARIVSDDRFRLVGKEVNGLIPVHFDKDSSGWINSDFEVLHKSKHNHIGHYFTNECIVQGDYDGNKGICSSTGETVVPAIYEILRVVGPDRFFAGKATMHNEYGEVLACEGFLMNSTGDRIGTESFASFFDFHEGIALAECFSDPHKSDSETYDSYIDLEGNIILPIDHGLVF